MTHLDDAREGSPSPRPGDRDAELDQGLKEKAQELAIFREAGVLTESEVEELMAKFRWQLP